MLVHIPQYPAMNPFDNPSVAIERQHLVLEFMYRDGYITEEEMVQAKYTPLVYAGGVQERYDILVPHFSVYARKQLEEMFGEALVYRGGLKVITSIDLDLQAQAAMCRPGPRGPPLGAGKRAIGRGIGQLSRGRVLAPSQPADLSTDHNISNASVVSIDPTHRRDSGHGGQSGLLG